MGSTPPLSRWLVSTAAKGLQAYVLESGKLRQMVGASELIEQLGHEVLDKVLAAIGGEPEMDFWILTRAAGGARVLFAGKESAEAFLRTWPAVVATYAPGLEVAQGIAELAPTGSLLEAIGEAEFQITANRSSVSPSLPLPVPPVERNRRSGKAAVESRDDDGATLFLDEESVRKILMADAGQRTLLGKLLPESHGRLGETPGCWPLDFQDMTAGESGYLAVVHADANKLGKLVLGLRNSIPASLAQDRQIQSYRAFSMKIEEATRQAAGKAMGFLLGDFDSASVKKIPLRPIVLAGDDLTVVMRADYAAEFTLTYLREFEAASARLFSEEPLGKLGLSGLTACAGIAYVKVAFPFFKSYELSESLCSCAKSFFNRDHSAVAFTRVTASTTGNYPEILREELTVSGGAALLTMNPYLVSGRNGPQFGTLLQLAKQLSDLPRSAFREVITKAQTSSLVESVDRWQRAWTVLTESKHSRGVPCTNLQQLMATLCGGNGGVPPALFDSPAAGAMPRTPLFDALEIAHLHGREDA